MVRSDGDIFLKNFGKVDKFWSFESRSRTSSLGLGVFDEVSVSSRNFNQVSVTVSKVTVSTTSLVLTLSFVPRIVLTKLKTTTLHNLLFSNLMTLVLWKNIVFENCEWHCFYSVLNNSIVYCHYYSHFRRCLQRSQAQQQKFCTCEKPNFSLNKEMHINVE